jgi:hypothetical protein
MGLRKLGRSRSVRAVWAALAALSLVHAPLPQPDFHNVRHHDGPGEVCEYHDHLLRWHPTAGVARDVAVLHWHWFVPTPESDAAPSDHAGPAVHAHVPAWLTGSWDEAPKVVSDGATRVAPRSAPCPLEQPCTLLSTFSPGHSLATGSDPPLGFGATFAPGVSLPTLLNRWIC